MFKTTLLTIALFGAALAHATPAQQVCDQVKTALTEIEPQLPITIDYMTKLTGTQAIYLTGQCLINYIYVVDSKQLLKEMSDSNQQDSEANLAHLATPEGIQTMQSVFGGLAEKAATAHFAEFAKIPGVRITYTHNFDHPKISTIVSVVLDTTKKTK